MTTRSSDKSLTNQHSNSESNLHSESGQQSTCDAPVENGNRTDSDCSITERFMEGVLAKVLTEF